MLVVVSLVCCFFFNDTATTEIYTLSLHDAFPICPLTFDADAFEETLLSVDEKTIPIPGTEIGKALDEAYRAMDKNARRKMVVLVTDGEDLHENFRGGDAGIVAAKRLATNGVVVFTI